MIDEWLTAGSPARHKLQPIQQQQIELELTLAYTYRTLFVLWDSTKKENPKYAKIQ